MMIIADAYLLVFVSFFVYLLFFVSFISFCFLDLILSTFYSLPVFPARISLEIEGQQVSSSFPDFSLYSG